MKMTSILKKKRKRKKKCTNLSTVIAIALVLVLLSSLLFQKQETQTLRALVRGLRHRGVQPRGPGGPRGAVVPCDVRLHQPPHRPLSHVDWLLGYTYHLLACPPCLGPIWWRHALAARGDCSMLPLSWWMKSMALSMNWLTSLAMQGAGHGHPFWHKPWHWAGVQAARCCLHCSEGQLTTER